MKPFLAATALALATFTGGHAASPSPSPYAGEQTRDIKALSAAEVADLLAGRGMGFAKAAELNGYPGPAHVLELSAQLQLSAEQRAQTQAIFDRMDAAAKALGARLVAAEAALEGQFRDRQVTGETLSRALEEAATIRGKLRQAHLQAHLEQTRVLTPEQVARYQHLRGYGQGASATHHPSHRHRRAGAHGRTGQRGHAGQKNGGHGPPSERMSADQRRRRSATRPNRPRPESASEPGSGTTAAAANSPDGPLPS